MIESAAASERPPRLETLGGFDRIAHLYRAMEYLSFGPMLERCRFHHLPALRDSRQALVIGDGDGRFLAKLFTSNSQIRAGAVDQSPAMLRRLKTRVVRVGAQNRLATICTDARAFEPPGANYDLVATHFFLDCLTESEAGHLIARLRPHLVPGALWLVSEFQVPKGAPFEAWLARRTISALYAAFRILTGLAVRQILPWPALLARHGFERIASRSWLRGLLVSELWQLPQATDLQPRALPSINAPRYRTPRQSQLHPRNRPRP